ncbi:MAG: hypothetical protein E6J34_10855 [Chloroflexi bacterium]|nr:MAG: hypothetical protein E6J34_10855 [Chloroflexota bacterium]
MTANRSSQSAISFPNFHPTPGLPASYDEQAQSWQVFRYDQVQDSSYVSGSLGLIAYPESNTPTDVAYSNAKLWTL